MSVGWFDENENLEVPSDYTPGNVPSPPIGTSQAIPQFQSYPLPQASQTEEPPSSFGLRPVAIRPQIKYSPQEQQELPSPSFIDYPKEFLRGAATTILSLPSGKLSNIIQKGEGKVKENALMQAMQSMGYSLTSTGAGALTQIALQGSKALGPYGLAAGAAVTGLVTMKATYEQALNSWYNQLNQDWLQKYNRTMTDDEWETAKDQYGLKGKALQSALWEAGTEAAGYVFLSKLWLGSLKKVLPKEVLASKLAKTLAGKSVYEQTTKQIAESLVKPTLARKAIGLGKKLALSQLEEQVEEVIANKNQADIEYDLGLIDQKPTYISTLVQQAAPVAISTLALGGLFSGGQRVSNLFTQHKINKTVEDNEVNAGDIAHSYMNAMIRGNLTPNEVIEQSKLYSKKPFVRDTILDTANTYARIGEMQDERERNIVANMASINYKLMALEAAGDKAAINKFVNDELPPEPGLFRDIAVVVQTKYPKMAEILNNRADDLIKTRQAADVIKTEEQLAEQELAAKDVANATTYPSGIILTPEGRGIIDEFVETRDKHKSPNNAQRIAKVTYARDYRDWLLGELDTQPTQWEVGESKSADLIRKGIANRINANNLATQKIKVNKEGNVVTPKKEGGEVAKPTIPLSGILTQEEEGEGIDGVVSKPQKQPVKPVIEPIFGVGVKEEKPTEQLVGEFITKPVREKSEVKSAITKQKITKQPALEQPISKQTTKIGNVILPSNLTPITPEQSQLLAIPSDAKTPSDTFKHMAIVSQTLPVNTAMVTKNNVQVYKGTEQKDNVATTTWKNYIFNPQTNTLNEVNTFEYIATADENGNLTYTNNIVTSKKPESIKVTPEVKEEVKPKAKPRIVKPTEQRGKKAISLPTEEITKPPATIITPKPSNIKLDQLYIPKEISKTNKRITTSPTFNFTEWDTNLSQEFKDRINRDMKTFPTIERFNNAHPGDTGANLYAREIAKQTYSTVAAVKPIVKVGDKYQGTAWRSETSNMGISSKATAQDVLDFEADELENNTREQAEKLGIDLSKYSAKDVIWVSPNKEKAQEYGTDMSTGEVFNPAEEVKLSPNNIVLAEDGDGGYLVLQNYKEKKKAVEEKKIGVKTKEKTIPTPSITKAKSTKIYEDNLPTIEKLGVQAKNIVDEVKDMSTELGVDKDYIHSMIQGKKNQNKLISKVKDSNLKNRLKGLLSDYNELALIRSKLTSIDYPSVLKEHPSLETKYIAAKKPKAKPTTTTTAAIPGILGNIEVEKPPTKRGEGVRKVAEPVKKVPVKERPPVQPTPSTKRKAVSIPITEVTETPAFFQPPPEGYTGAGKARTKGAVDISKLKGDDALVANAQTLGIRSHIVARLKAGLDKDIIISSTLNKIKGGVDKKTITNIIDAVERKLEEGRVPRFRGVKKIGVTTRREKVQPTTIPVTTGETKQGQIAKPPTTNVKHELAITKSRDEYTDELMKNKQLHFTIRKSGESKRSPYIIYFNDGETETPVNEFLDKSARMTFSTEKKARDYLDEKTAGVTRAENYFQVAEENKAAKESEEQLKAAKEAGIEYRRGEKVEPDEIMASTKRREKAELVGELTERTEQDRRFAVEREHREIVTRALNNGEEVSGESIKDYKNLPEFKDRLEKVGKDRYKFKEGMKFKITPTPTTLPPEQLSKQITREIDTLHSSLTKERGLTLPTNTSRNVLNLFAERNNVNPDHLSIVNPQTSFDKAAVIMANIFGSKVIFYEKSPELKTELPGGSYYNGFLILPSSDKSKILMVVGHELGHSLKHKDYLAYKQLYNHLYTYSPERIKIDALIKIYDKKAIANNYTKWTDLTYVQKVDEIINDLIGNRLVDNEFWTGLHNQNSGLFNKLHNLFIKLLTKLSNLVSPHTLRIHFNDITTINNLIDSAMHTFAEKNINSKNIETITKTSKSTNNHLTVQSVADTFTRSIPIGSQISSLPSISFLPQSILNRIALENIDIANISSIYDKTNNVIHLLSGNLRTPQDVHEAILTTSLSNNGIRGTFGNTFNSILNDLYKLYTTNSKLSLQLNDANSLPYIKSIEKSDPNLHKYYLSSALLETYLRESFVEPSILQSIKTKFNSLTPIIYSDSEIIRLIDHVSNYNANLLRESLITDGTLDGSTDMKFMVDMNDPDSPYLEEAKKNLPKLEYVKKNGQPVWLYHATNRDFKINEFIPFSHFGTRDAAIEILKKLSDVYTTYTSKSKLKVKGKSIFVGESHTLRTWVAMGLSNSYITNPEYFTPNYLSGKSLIPVYLAINNPIRLKENRTLSWESLDIAHELVRVGVMTSEEFTDLEYNIPLEMQPEYIKNIIKSKGYDGIVYENKREDVGSDSYIPLDNSQIVSGFIEVNPTNNKNAENSYTININDDLSSMKFFTDPDGYFSDKEKEIARTPFWDMMATALESQKRIAQAEEYMGDDYTQDLSSVTVKLLPKSDQDKFKSFAEAMEINKHDDMSKVPDSKFIEKIGSLPFYYLGQSRHYGERVIFRAAADREEDIKIYEHKFLEKEYPTERSLLTSSEELIKLDKEEVKKVDMLMVDADRSGTIHTEQELESKGFSDSAIKAWKDRRKILDNVLDEFIEILKKKLANYRELGIEDKRIIVRRMGKDSAGRPIEIETQVKTMIDNISKLKGSYYPRMRESGNWSVTAYNRNPDGTNITAPFYREYKYQWQANRARNKLLSEGYTDRFGRKYTFTGADEPTRTSERSASYTNAAKGILSMNKFSTNLLKKMDKDFKRNKIRSFDEIPDIVKTWTHNYVKLDGTQLPQLMIAVDPNSDNYDLYRAAFKKIKGTSWESIAEEASDNKKWFESDSGEIRQLQDWVHRGKNKKDVKDNYRLVSVWRFNNPDQNLRRNIVFAINQQRGNEYMKNKLDFEYQLIQNENELLIENTYQSSLIRRGKFKNDDVYVGYDEDAYNVLRSYVRKMSSGMATSKMVGNMISALHGTFDASPNQFENFDDFMEFTKARKIDPDLHRNRYNRSVWYINDLIDRDYRAENIFAIAKASIAGAYMGFSPISGLVNITSNFTATPYVLNTYLKMPLTQVPLYIERAREYYNLYKSNPDKLIAKGYPGLASMFNHMQYSDWIKSEMNEEAVGVGVRATKTFSKIVRNALVFMRITEERNRLYAMGAAYLYLEDMNNKGYVGFNNRSQTTDNPLSTFRYITEYKKLGKQQLVDENNITHPLHDYYVEVAKEVSDVANGVYGQINKPYFAQGKGIFPKFIASQAMFTRYVHTQILNLAENGITFRNKKAAIYTLLAPILLAGIRGNPIYGPLAPYIYKLIAVVTGDDDPEESFYRFIHKLGNDDIEKFTRDGLVGLLTPITLRNSIAFQLPTLQSGIPYSMYKSIKGSGQALLDHEYGRAFERMNVRMVSSLLRARREYTKGAETYSGKPMWLGTEKIKPTFSQAMIIALGGNPVDYSFKKEQLWKDQIVESKYVKKRKKINDMFRRADNSKKWSEAIKEARRYNQTLLNHKLYGIPPITDSSVKNAIDNPPDNFQLGRGYRMRELRGESEEEE